jgi:hypothetical protein
MLDGVVLTPKTGTGAALPGAGRFWGLRDHGKSEIIENGLGRLDMIRVDGGQG